MLTPKQEAFAVAVASGMSQSDAYRTAYPTSAKWLAKSVWERASALAADAKVQARIADLLKKAAESNDVTVERLLREMARLAFIDPRKLVGPGGAVLPLHELDEDTARAVASMEVSQDFEFTEDGKVPAGYTKKVKLWDKRASLEMLGRHLKMFTDRVEHSADDSLRALLNGTVKRG